MRRLFFVFNDTATTEIYTLSLHDALPIWGRGPGGGRSAFPAGLPRAAPRGGPPVGAGGRTAAVRAARGAARRWERSEEHTSELQSRQYLVCRLLLEKKRKISQGTWLVRVW